MKTGLELIAEERQRQIESKGFCAERDDTYVKLELLKASACYVAAEEMREIDFDVSEVWPWPMETWKPSPDNRIKELQKAGALIAAEIDRLNRLKSYGNPQD